MSTTNQMPKAYEAAEVEAKWYPLWESRGYFHGNVNPEKKPYSIVIPPPNVTGILHLGHILNNTLQDILIRYKDVKRIYGYKMDTYWSNIASVDDYFHMNMDFLKPEVRDYFFRKYPGIHSKVADLPPAKFNVGGSVHNSLLSSGCIVNGAIENSVLFQKVYVGNNCVIRNSLILDDVHIGDNAYIENCIVESRDTIRANSCYKGENEIKIVIERDNRYVV